MSTTRSPASAPPKASTIRYLLRLAEAEIIERERRLVDRRIKAAKFPTVKSLDSFDFAAFPDLNRTAGQSGNDRQSLVAASGAG